MREGMVLEDRYEVLRLLGRGGLGEVWEGQDRRLRRRVAVKFATGVVRYPEAARRFAHEAVVLASLQHRGIVTVYDSGTVHGEFGGQLPYIVMELLTGATWESARVDSVPETAAAVADALAHAHHAKIAHRDVKPANIMIEADGTPVLLDFGIARDDNALTSTVTATGHGFGTPLYMAPEQLAGARGDAAADVYALGLIVLEKLTGRRKSADLDPDRSPLGPRTVALLARMLSPVADGRVSAAECAAELRALARPSTAGGLGTTRPGAQPERPEVDAAADPYRVLGVARNASQDEVKRAFRRLARQLHPDVNPDGAGRKQWVEVDAAYKLISATWPSR